MHKLHEKPDIELAQRETGKARAVAMLERDLGAEFLSALYDPHTVEILLNPDGRIWQECLGEQLKPIGHMRPEKAQAILRAVAGFHEKIITRESPIIECEFPIDGSRFAGQLPPVVPHPCFAIRKKAIRVFTLNQYVTDDIMTQVQCDAIQHAIENHRNILVVGGTGSGKTTLINAIILGMVDYNPDERIVIIEDTGEIQCKAENYVQYHTTVNVNMTLLLRTTLRMRPDRILVGEVRGPEALDLLMAWNTGHEGGAATIHANNAKAGLSRLAMLISMHSDSPSPIEPLIAEAVHVVVYISRDKHGRRVRSIMEVQGFSNGQYHLSPLGE